MQQTGIRPVRPALKALVMEASRALAALDAARLEELAVSCQALNKALSSMDAGERKLLEAGEAREAEGEMAVFARVLEATRSNLKVMERLRELRQCDFGRIEYSERQARGCMTESGHGDH